MRLVRVARAAGEPGAEPAGPSEPGCHRLGLAVRPVEEGTVNSVGFEPSGLGTWIAIGHGRNLQTSRGHLCDAPTVHAGDHVTTATRIGAVGSRGQSLPAPTTAGRARRTARSGSGGTTCAQLGIGS